MRLSFGILRCSRKAALQHLSVVQKLSTILDALFQDIFDCDIEDTECRRRLDIEM